MAVPVRITARDVACSGNTARFARSRAERLVRRHARLTSCHVIIERPCVRSKGGYHVRLDLGLPGHPVVVSQEGAVEVRRATVRGALSAAFQKATERLGRRAHRRRRT
jgi:putative sigma-54 modulation protein